MIKTVLMSGVMVVATSYVASDLARPSPNKPILAAAHPAAVADAPGRVTLLADPDGHFRVDATIAGRRVPMMVDTGATVVALSYDEARTLGLISGADRFDLRVSTANGQVGAKRVVLNELRIGSLSVSNVQAVVLADGAMDGALLGMSFLNRLRKMEATGDRLTLER